MEFNILGWTLSWIWFTIGFLIWLAIAFWPARVAKRRGHSFLLFFIFSLFFFPLALLVAYLMPNRSRTAAASAPAPAPADSQE